MEEEEWRQYLINAKSKLEAANIRVAKLEAELAHMKQVAGAMAISYQQEKAMRERIEAELAECRAKLDTNRSER